MTRTSAGGIGLFAMRLVLGAVFLWNGIAKVQQPYDFLSSVYSYDMVSPGFGLFLAYSLPWVEIVVGASMLMGLLLMGSFSMSSILCLLFVVAKWSAVHRNLEISCGCKLISAGEMMGVQDVLATAVLLGCSIVGLVLSYTASTRNGEECMTVAPSPALPPQNSHPAMSV